MSPFLTFLDSAKELVTKKKQNGAVYNPFMVQRILSMDKQCLPTISNIQLLLEGLSPLRQQVLLKKLLPQKNNFSIKYISMKTKKENVNANKEQ